MSFADFLEVSGQPDSNPARYRCAFCQRGRIEDGLGEAGQLYLHRPSGGDSLRGRQKRRPGVRSSAFQGVIILDSSSEDEAGQDPLCFHYFCILFSSQMDQNGIAPNSGFMGDEAIAQTHSGLFGFLIGDILKEIERTQTFPCQFCSGFNANIECRSPGCSAQFHYQCGMDSGSQFVFHDDFPSYCPKHRQELIKLMEPPQVPISKDKTCLCCYEKVLVRKKAKNRTLGTTNASEYVISPCCGRTFHWLCVQKMAIAGGSVLFKCPNCLDNNVFVVSMRKCGIYIPLQDSTHPVPNLSLQPTGPSTVDIDPEFDLLSTVPRLHCDVPIRCKCKQGRTHNRVGTLWELIPCQDCGIQAIHIECGKLNRRHPDYACETCIENKQPAPNPGQESPQSSSVSKGGKQSAAAHVQPEPPLPKMTLTKQQGQWISNVRDKPAPKSRRSTKTRDPLGNNDSSDQETTVPPKVAPQPTPRSSVRPRGRPKRVDRPSKVREPSSSPEIVIIENSFITSQHKEKVNRPVKKGSKTSQVPQSATTANGRSTSRRAQNQTLPPESHSSKRKLPPSTRGRNNNGRLTRGKRTTVPGSPSRWSSSSSSSPPRHDLVASDSLLNEDAFMDDCPDYVSSEDEPLAKRSKTQSKNSEPLAIEKSLSKRSGSKRFPSQKPTVALEASSEDEPLSRKWSKLHNGSASPKSRVSITTKFARRGSRTPTIELVPVPLPTKTGPKSRKPATGTTGGKDIPSKFDLLAEQSAPQKPKAPKTKRVRQKSPSANQSPPAKVAKINPKPSDIRIKTPRNSNAKCPLVCLEQGSLPAGQPSRSTARQSRAKDPLSFTEGPTLPPKRVSRSRSSIVSPSPSRSPCSSPKRVPLPKSRATSSMSTRAKPAMIPSPVAKFVGSKSTSETVTPVRSRNARTKLSTQQIVSLLCSQDPPRGSRSKTVASPRAIARRVSRSSSSSSRTCASAPSPPPPESRSKSASKKRPTPLKKPSSLDQQAQTKRRSSQTMRTQGEAENEPHQDFVAPTRLSRRNSAGLATPRPGPKSRTRAKAVNDIEVVATVKNLFDQGEDASLKDATSQSRKSRGKRSASPMAKAMPKAKKPKMTPVKAIKMSHGDIVELCQDAVGHLVKDWILKDSEKFCRSILSEVVDEAEYRLFGPPLSLPLSHTQAPKIIGKLQGARVVLVDFALTPIVPKEAAGIFCDEIVSDIIAQAENEILERPIYKERLVSDTLLDMIRSMQVASDDEIELHRVSIVSARCEDILVETADNAERAIMKLPIFPWRLCGQIINELVDEMKLKPKSVRSKRGSKKGASAFDSLLSTNQRIPSAHLPPPHQPSQDDVISICQSVVNHLVNDWLFQESFQFCSTILEDVADEAEYRLFGAPRSLPLNHVKAPKILAKLQGSQVVMADFALGRTLPREATRIFCDELLFDVIAQAESDILQGAFYKEKLVANFLNQVLLNMHFTSPRKIEVQRKARVKARCHEIVLQICEQSEAEIVHTSAFSLRLCHELLSDLVDGMGPKILELRIERERLSIEEEERREAEARRPKPCSVRLTDIYTPSRIHSAAVEFLCAGIMFQIVEQAEATIAIRPLFGQRMASLTILEMVNQLDLPAGQKKRQRSISHTFEPKGQTERRPQPSLPLAKCSKPFTSAHRPTRTLSTDLAVNGVMGLRNGLSTENNAPPPFPFEGRSHRKGKTMASWKAAHD